MITFSPVIAHVDMDAFFASIEIRNNPGLKGKPVIVGGGINARSVVSTCSYEARKYGVHSGMSTAGAKRLCPHAVFISAGLCGYVYASARLLKIFEKYSPVVEPVSVDEAFLYITGTERLFGGPEKLVETMKREIRDKLGLSCSIGVAPGKYLAKLASGLKKPDGVTVLDRDDFKNFFSPKPVDSLWGVGESTKKMLNRQGIHTVGDLAGTDARLLRQIFGKNGDALVVMSRGSDESEVHRIREMPDDKSMSHETTLGEDLIDPSMIRATILWLSDKVARRMRKGGYIGRTISVKVRSSDFKTITRSHTISPSTDRYDIIYNNAIRLIPREYGLKERVRLLGVRVSQLKKIRDDYEDETDAETDKTHRDQLELMLNEKDSEISRLTRAVDAIRDKYGEQSIKPAGTLMH